MEKMHSQGGVYGVVVFLISGWRIEWCRPRSWTWPTTTMSMLLVMTATTSPLLRATTKTTMSTPVPPAAPRAAYYQILGPGHQCKDDYCHQLSVIFESVETFIRIVGLYLGVVPLTCIPVLSIPWLFYSIIHHLMCVDTYSLNCIQFPLWTLIDSFVWNEIVHCISCDIRGWYHQYDAYSTPIRWSRVRLSFLPESVGVACSPILSVSFEEMGCELVLNSAATPYEAVSIICTIVNKTILLTLWGKLMYVSYTTNWPVFSRASCRCSSYSLSFGSFDMVDLCLWDALSRRRSSWRVFTCPMCMPIIFWTGHINSCMFMISYWLLYYQVAC